MPQISVRGMEMPESPIRKLAPLSDLCQEERSACLSFKYRTA